MLNDLAQGLFWLFLPVAAASGWLVARKHYDPKKREQSYPDLHRNYYKGVDFLSDAQPDKAIDVFIDLLQSDSQSIETHLTLGNLFRRRGEVDQAIQIHEKIISQPKLTDQQRRRALYELGLDYKCSGWLDRAEDLFEELAYSGDCRTMALRQLVEIYQQEHDWDKAIHFAKEAQIVSGQDGQDMKRRIAHFYCEKAEEYRRLGNIDRSKDLLTEALGMDPSCVRAHLLYGALFAEAGDYESALVSYKQVIQNDAEFTVEALYPLLTCYKELGDTQGFVDYVESLTCPQKEYCAVVIAELYAESAGTEQAINYIDAQLRKRPSADGLDKLLEFLLRVEASPSKRYLDTVRTVTMQLLPEGMHFLCRHCGFHGKALHWQCPGCKYWGEIKPVMGR